MREVAAKRLLRGSLRLKLTYKLKLSLIIKSILLAYYLLQYVPCWLQWDLLRAIFVYSEGMCNNKYFQMILMPLQVLAIGLNVYVLVYLRLELPQINVRYLRFTLYFGFLESLISTVFGIVFLYASTSRTKFIIGCVLTLGINLIVNVLLIQIKVFKMG